jgi:hypothetical protein
MASTDNCVDYDVLFSKEFGKFLGLKKKHLKTLKKLSKIGLIQRERLVEIAISNLSGIAMDSTHGRDHADGSDTKTVVSVMRNNEIARGGWTNSFTIRNVKTKTGALRIVAYNKLQGKFHYFFIPKEAYGDTVNQVEIVIEKVSGCASQPNFTGNPSTHRKWWNYEVASFEELCKLT